MLVYLKRNRFDDDNWADFGLGLIRNMLVRSRFDKDQIGKEQIQDGVGLFRIRFNQEQTGEI